MSEYILNKVAAKEIPLTNREDVPISYGSILVRSILFSQEIPIGTET